MQLLFSAVQILEKIESLYEQNEPGAKRDSHNGMLCFGKSQWRKGNLTLNMIHTNKRKNEYNPMFHFFKQVFAKLE